MVLLSLVLLYVQPKIVTALPTIFTQLIPKRLVMEDRVIDPGFFSRVDRRNAHQFSGYDIGMGCMRAGFACKFSKNFSLVMR